MPRNIGIAALLTILAPAAAYANDDASGAELVAAVSSLPTLLPVPVPAPAPAAHRRELVAEALFLYDALPPAGRDLNLSVAIAEGEPDESTGRTSVVALPRLQLAMALGERVGFTADVGFASNGEVVDAPGASLKVLLRAADAGRTGLAASVDLFGSTHALGANEAGLGLGAIRQVGRVGLRASAAIASGVTDWTPHLHTGVSAAVALGQRWRLLGEVVSEVAAGEATFAAGPTVKVSLGESTALMAGALFDVSSAAGTPVFTFQLTRSL
jgi:hypothetical protein